MLHQNKDPDFNHFFLPMIFIWTITSAFGFVLAAENETLSKALNSMSSILDSKSLKTTLVRTHYKSCPVEKFEQGFEPPVRRTSISEIIVDNNRVRESVSDDRKTLLNTKHNFYTYSNNSGQIKLYDPSNNKGTIRKTPSHKKDYLFQLISPFSSLKEGKLISRDSIDISRFQNVLITSETKEGNDSNARIILKGTFVDALPYDTFEISILPGCNYAITSVVEYNKKGNTLTDIESIDFKKIGDLWVPGSILCLKYNYDPSATNTVSMSLVDILKPEVAKIPDRDFDLIFPKGTKTYDTELGLDISTIRNEADSVALDFFTELYNFKAINSSKNQDVINRAKKALKDERANKVATKKPDSTYNSQITNERLKKHISHKKLNSPQSLVKKIGLWAISFLALIVLLKTFKMKTQKALTRKEVR